MDCEPVLQAMRRIKEKEVYADARDHLLQSPFLSQELREALENEIKREKENKQK